MERRRRRGSPVPAGCPSAMARGPALLGLEGLLVIKVEEEEAAAASGHEDGPDPEHWRQRFRQFGRRGEAAGPQEALAHLRALCHWWLRPDLHTKEQMVELLVLEQFLTLVPREVRVRVREERLTRAEDVLALLEGLDRLLEENGPQMSGVLAWPQERLEGGQGVEVSPARARPQPPPGPSPVAAAGLTFADVTVSFSWEEWGHLEPGQKELYRDVLWESYGHLGALGIPAPKPDLIALIDGEEEARDRHLHVAGEESVARGARAGCGQSLGEGHPQEKKGPPLTVPRAAGPLQEHAKPPKPEARIRVWPEGPQGPRVPPTPQPSPQPQVPPRGGRGMSPAPPRALPGEMATRGPKQYRCWDCGKCFHCKSPLVRHQRTHTGEKPFKCADCGKDFSQRSNLNIHRRVHTGEKPYTCAECGKGFSHQTTLRIHRRTHGKEKPYMCAECGKGFSQTSHLHVHRRVHTGEKPYQCLVCGKGFKQSSNLQVHQRVHRGAAASHRPE